MPRDRRLIYDTYRPSTLRYGRYSPRFRPLHMLLRDVERRVSQQVVVWAQTRDRAAAMLANVVVSIGKLDAIPTDRRCDRTWSWHHHRRRRPVLGSSRPRQNDALWTRVLLAMVDLLVGRTQWVVLSAPDVHPWCGASRAGPGRGVDGADGAIQPLVTVLSQPLTQRADSR